MCVCVCVCVCVHLCVCISLHITSNTYVCIQISTFVTLYDIGVIACVCLILMVLPLVWDEVSAVEMN